jgi:hypothetical protein
MAIRRNQRIGPVEEPGRAGHLPWQNRPPSLTADGKSQCDCSSTSDLDATIGDGPRGAVALGFAHPGGAPLVRCLRRDNVEPVKLVETSHPASATCAKASIPVEDERGALWPMIRKLPEVDGAHTVSVPAAD